jgi:hypothetical protein
MNIKVVLALAAGVLFLSVPLVAHHGTNISYDHDKPVTLKGTVTEFVFSNPHAQIYFDVKDDKGTTVHWGGELNSPSNLRRDGWTKDTMKPGDQLTLTVFPSKAGTTVGVVDRSKPVNINGKDLPGRTNSVD